MLALRDLRALFCLLSLLACSPELPATSELPPEYAVACAEDGPIDQAILPAEQAHAGQSGFRLVSDGTEAFALRAQSAERAVRSLDVQTYIWHADLTGMALAHALLEAADRGVRVRLLLDDMDARAKSAGLAALAAHPNVAVRLFNPFASRSGWLSKIHEGLWGFGRLNGRMHNKAWIADNRLALAGGRNLGDEYFQASEQVNFVDLDFAMVGPVVRDVSASFDRYWNASTVIPIELLSGGQLGAEQLQQLRVRLAAHARAARQGRYAQALRADDAVERMVSAGVSLNWAANYRFVSDDPRKVTLAPRAEARAHVAAVLEPVIARTQRELTIISPYFVPGAATPQLARLAQDGRRLRVLTNSLASNDVTAVHGGYARYRQPLLEAGVELWELKRLSGGGDSSLLGSSGASLHTKAFAVDQRVLFVGSFNLDARSTWLNCEQGVLVESANLARQLLLVFAEHTSAASAWRVGLREGALRWSAGEQSLDTEPGASLARRVLAWASGWLPLEPQL
ncbi:MAG TPA: phospholipase D family protein [Polyangiales bacterium]